MFSGLGVIPNSKWLIENSEELKYKWQDPRCPAVRLYFLKCNITMQSYCHFWLIMETLNGPFLLVLIWNLVDVMLLGALIINMKIGWINIVLTLFHHITWITFNQLVNKHRFFQINSAFNHQYLIPQIQLRFFCLQTQSNLNSNWMLIRCLCPLVEYLIAIQ